MITPFPCLIRLTAAVIGGFMPLVVGLTAQAQDTAMPIPLHYFDSHEGFGPGQLVLGDDGNVYGTTAYGGFDYYAAASQSGDGSVFRISPTGEYTSIYAFPGGVRGKNPNSLIRGIDGNFYGLTSAGGSAGYGTVFRLTPNGDLTTVYDLPTDASVSGPLVQDENGNFYGVRGAETSTGKGSIFRLSSAGEYTTLYAFLGEGDGGFANGLINGGDGNFYGTSMDLIFRISPTGDFTIVYSFAGEGDGSGPNGLTLGSNGDLYGSTQGGGVDQRGVIFRCTLSGTYTVLYAFMGGADGQSPGGRLVEGSDGNFYGITRGTTAAIFEPARQPTDAGTTPAAIILGPPVPPTIFRITPKGAFTSLYASDRALSGFVLGSDGNFYGTDYLGNTAFKLSIVSHPGFFANQAPLTNGTYYLSFSSGNYFGYYTFQTDPNQLYHIDLGPEYFFDANDGEEGLYLYDFRSNGFFYTSPTFPFPYLYDFSLDAVLYYFPDPNNPGRYNSDSGTGKRYFYNFATSSVISK